MRPFNRRGSITETAGGAVLQGGHAPAWLDLGVEPSAARSLDRLADCGLAVTAGFLVFGLYVTTLAPTIVAGDAGELVTAAWELGVAHPPGYPLWCLLSHLWLSLLSPDLDVAYRVNLFSAFCGGTTCALAYGLARALGISRISSFAAALLLGASRELWAQSVIAEVYSLNAVLFTGCLYCLVRWDRSHREGWLLGFAGLLGLGLANHHTIGILGPVGLAWVLWRQWRVLLKWRLVLLSTVLFLMPLTLYLYLPWRSAAEPYMDWGRPRTLSAVIEHVSRAQYKVSYEPAERHVVNIFFQITTLLRYFLDQFSPVVGLALLGAVPWMLRRRRDTAWFFLATACLVIWIAYGWLLNTKPERQEIVANQVFFIPVYVVAAILAAGVFDELRGVVQSRLRMRAGGGAARALEAVCLLGPILLAVLHNYPANDFGDYWHAEDHARNLLGTIEADGVIFPSGDHNTFPLIYLHRVERQRQDIVIADKYGYVEARDFPRVAAKLAPVDERNVPAGRLPRDAVIHHLLAETERPVYFTVKTPLPDIPRVHQVQTGLLYRAAKSPPPADKSPEALWETYRYRNLVNGFANPPDYGAINVASDYFFFRGLTLLHQNRVEEAVASMSRAAELAWGIKEVHNNVGSALAEAGLLAAADQHYRRALRLDDGYVSALWNVARTASATGDYGRAAGHFLKLLEVSPEDFRVPGELGFLHLRRLGQTRQAIDYLEASLALNDHQPQIERTLHELATVSVPELFPAVLEAERVTHDFGEVVQGDEVSTEILIRNISDQSLTLTDVRADCSCTTPSVAVKTIAAGETAPLNIHFHESKRLGPQTRKVIIENDGGPPLALTIHAHVLSPYAAVPRKLVIDEAVPHSRHEITLTLRSRTGKAFRIQKLESDVESLQPPEVVQARQSEHSLVFTWAAGEEAGQRQGRVRFMLDDGSESVIEVPVHLAVREVVQLSPKSLFLTSLSRDEEAVHTIYISLPKDWSAMITDIQASASWIELVNPPEALGNQTKLTVRLRTAEMPETFNGSVAITTDHPNVPPVVVPIYGFLE